MIPQPNFNYFIIQFRPKVHLKIIKRMKKRNVTIGTFDKERVVYQICIQFWAIYIYQFHLLLSTSFFLFIIAGLILLWTCSQTNANMTEAVAALQSLMYLPTICTVVVWLQSIAFWLSNVRRWPVCWNAKPDYMDCRFRKENDYNGQQYLWRSIDRKIVIFFPLQKFIS